MNTQQPQPTKAPAAVQITTKVANDGFVEILVDVTGGFVFRDRLKSAGFRFVREEGQQSEGQTDRRKPAAFWRRILVAVPPGISNDRVVKGMDIALDELQQMLDGILEGSRVRGGRAAAAVLQQHWEGKDELVPVIDRLANMDSPWENTVQRPPFAA